MDSKIACPYCGSTNVAVEYDEKLHSVETGYAKCLDCEVAFPYSPQIITYYRNFQNALSYLQTNETKALDKLTSLAVHGYAPACRQLGIYFAPYSSTGFSTRSAAKARYWFEQGFALKDAASANLLGVLYWKGEGIPKDPEKAYGCWTLAWSLIKDHEADLKAKIQRNIDVYNKSLTSSPQAEPQKAEASREPNATKESDPSKVADATTKPATTRDDILNMAFVRHPSVLSTSEARELLRVIAGRIIPEYLSGMRAEDAILRSSRTAVEANASTEDTYFLFIFLQFLLDELPYARNTVLVEEVKDYIVNLLIARLNS